MNVCPPNSYYGKLFVDLLGALKAAESLDLDNKGLTYLEDRWRLYLQIITPIDSACVRVLGVENGSLDPPFPEGGLITLSTLHSR